MPFASGNLIPKVFCRGQLSNSNATLYTAPATNTGCFAIIKEIWLMNTDSSDRTVTLYVVEAGGTAAANRAILSAVTIDAGRMYRIPCATVLGSALVSATLTGDTIQGLASSASKVTYLISGVEST
jgi:hypothetical protein